MGCERNVNLAPSVDRILIGVPATGHFRFLATIDAGGFLCAPANRGAEAIHGSVASADNHDAFAGRSIAGKLRETGVVFCSRKGKAWTTPFRSAPGISSGWDFRESKPRKTALKLERRSPRARSAPSLRFELEHHAAFLEDINPALDDGAFDAEGGSAVDQQASGQDAGVENRDGIAFAGEFFSRGQAARAGTDDGDFKAIRRRGGDIHLAVLEGVFNQELFDGIDGDGFRDAIEDALVFAEADRWGNSGCRFRRDW